MTQSLASRIKEVINTKWSMINTFTVDAKINDKLFQASKVNPELFKRENLNLVIKEFPLPQHSVSDTDSQTGLDNRHAMGRIQEFSFDVTFRDRDQLVYYRAFKHMMDAARWIYPDEARIDFTVYKDPDYLGEDENCIVDKLKRCVINAISNVTFSQETEAQIAEFTVSFKAIERESGK